MQHKRAHIVEILNPSHVHIPRNLSIHLPYLQFTTGFKNIFRFGHEVNRKSNEGTERPIIIILNWIFCAHDCGRTLLLSSIYSSFWTVNEIISQKKKEHFL